MKQTVWELTRPPHFIYPSRSSSWLPPDLSASLNCHQVSTVRWMAHQFRSSRSGLENSGMSVGPVLLLDGTGDHASWPVLGHRKHSNDESHLHHQYVDANGLDAEGAPSERSSGQVSFLAPPPAEIPRHIIAQVRREQSSSGDGKGTTFSDISSAADAPQASSRPKKKRREFHWPRPASAA